MRVYDGVHAHPIGDFTGDLAQVLSFPDAKNTTFKIEDNTIGIISYGVNFPFPKKTGTSNDFQISFSAQDFSHATYFCVNIYYNLDTGEFKMADQEKEVVAITASKQNVTASKQNDCQKLNSNYCSGSKSDPQGTCCDNMFCKYWQAPIGRTCMGCYSCKCDNGGPGSTDDPSKCVNADGKLCPFVEEC